MRTSAWDKRSHCKREYFEEAKERRRLYRHISNYPVHLVNELTRNGSITLEEQEERLNLLTEGGFTLKYVYDRYLLDEPKETLS